MRLRWLALFVLSGCHSTPEDYATPLELKLTKSGAVYHRNTEVLGSDLEDRSRLNELLQQLRQSSGNPGSQKGSGSASVSVILDAAAGTPFEHVSNLANSVYLQAGAQEVIVRVGEFQESIPFSKRPEGNPWFGHGILPYLQVAVCARGSLRRHFHDAEKHLVEDHVVDRVIVTVEDEIVYTLPMDSQPTLPDCGILYQRLAERLKEIVTREPSDTPLRQIVYCNGTPVEYILMAHRAFRKTGREVIEIGLCTGRTMNRKERPWPPKGPPVNLDPRK